MTGAERAKRSAIIRMLRSQWALVALAVVYCYCFPYFPTLRHANELPRILTTEQLAESGTFSLDDRLSDLGSRADVSTTPDGHAYQNKAPGLSILGVVLYYPLSVTFEPSGRRPPLALVTWLLRTGLATLPTLWFLSQFRRVARRFADTEEARGAALAAYALGSMALPLGMLFMSHALAASLVGTAFARAVDVVRERSRDEVRGALGAGALLGLSMLVEYQAIFAAPLVAGYLVWGANRRWRTAVALALAILPFIGVLAWYHWSAFGSPFRTGYAYSVDSANRMGVMGIVGFSKESLAQLLVRPDNGLLLLSPWVLLSVVGLVSIAARPELRTRVGREALVAGLIALVYCVFVGALYPEFGRGGWSVGPRYIAVAMPFLAWLAAAGLDVCLGSDLLRVPAFATVLIGVGVHVLAVSTYPHWPVDFQNPIFEVSIRALREGHAPYSLGTLIGLAGVASLVPLYLLVVALMFRLLTPSRRYGLEVSLAIVVSVLVVSSYRLLATTPAQPAEQMWKFVAGTFER